MFMIRSGGWIRTVSVPGSGHRYARRFPGFVMSCRRWAMPGNLLPRRLAGLACSGASSKRRKSRNRIRRGTFLSRLQENQGVFEAQGLDAISVRGAVPAVRPLAIGKGNFQLPLPVDGLWMLCFRCLPLVRGREAGPEAGCPKRIRAGMCSIEDSLSKDRLPGQPRDDGECIGFGMIY